MLHQEPDQHDQQDQQHIHFDSISSLRTRAIGLVYRRARIATESIGDQPAIWRALILRLSQGLLTGGVVIS